MLRRQPRLAAWRSALRDWTCATPWASHWPGLATGGAVRCAAATASSGTADGGRSEQLRAAVVGSGPAGMYTAQRLLKVYGEAVRVDILDRLPTPFGLVRSGVAADHAETKNVVNQFDGILADPRVRFFGNVEAGRHVGMPRLRDMYHAVVLAYGTETDRRLGIPGEDMPGVFSAREFVWWYNGHPDCASLPVDLSAVRSVAILGLGNVALDCARVLLKAPEGPLAQTDISGKALEELRRSTVKEVHIVGRRGIAQAQFTGKELKEILFEVPGIRAVVQPESLELSEADKAELAGSRQKKRTVDLISKAAADSTSGGAAEGSGRELHFRFKRSSAEIVAGPGGTASCLRLEKNTLTGGQEGAPQCAKGTGEFEELPVDLVLTCIGYRGLPAEGLPFDERSGTIPNTHGRVEGPEAAGVYAAGWIARGPSGKIGECPLACRVLSPGWQDAISTGLWPWAVVNYVLHAGSNLADANDVVEMIDADLNMGILSAQDPTDLAVFLNEEGIKFVDCDGWRKIDSAELEAGRLAGKAREKLLSVEEMILATLPSSASS